MESGWRTPIDIYCERTDATFWSEPVNAITNVAFLLAAFAIYLRWRRAPADWPALALILVLTAIGIGSFLFHTFADRWSVMADVIPITVFIYVYFFFAMRRFFDLGVVVSLAITAMFLVVSIAIDSSLPRGFLNGSGGYLPALFAILAVGGLLVSRKPRIGGLLLLSGVVFVVSVTMRSVDMAACDSIAIGTHFLWHVLNALTLYVLLVALMAGRLESARQR